MPPTTTTPQPSIARALSAQDKATQLRNLPTGATRVQVRDSKGKNCWRKIDEVSSADTLMFGADGKPVVMRGEPGRKRTTLEPATDAAKEILAAKTDHIAHDELVAAMKDDPAAETVLDLVMREMTMEASSLEFERKEAERHNTDTSGLSVKRARILASVGEMYLKRREKLSDAQFDLDTPYAQAFISFFLDTFKETLMSSGVRPEHIETIFAKLGKRCDESWKLEAKSKMREAKK